MNTQEREAKQPVETGDLQGVDLPQRSEAEQRAFFDATLACAFRAQERCGVVVRVIEIAGIRIRLAFAGPALEREFIGALSHLLTSPEGACDATFNIWDSATTGVRMEPPPCTRSAFTDRGDIWGFSSKRIRSAFHWSEYSVCLLDVETGIGNYWVQTPANLPYWARSSPMRSLFHWLLEPRGFHLIHGAAVGTEHGAVLITGKGGVGKSTTSLACLAANMTFSGDDYLVVSLNPEPMVHMLYSTAKLIPEQLEWIPELKDAAAERRENDEKAVLYLHPSHRERLARVLPLRWLLTPRFGASEQTYFESLPEIELHRASAFTTMSQLPHAGLATHEFIARLIQHVPGARLVLGRNIRSVPDAIAGLLEHGADIPAPKRQRMRPLVSVIIPVYNGAHFLREAIQSVLSQDYPAVEIIIVDDGSTDDIAQAVEQLQIDVRFFRQRNQGPAAARNRGIRDASGDLITFLDVDDLWPTNTLRSLVDALAEDTDADVLLGRGQLARMDPSGNTGIEFVGNPEESFPYYIGAGLYRRAAFERIGTFDESMRFGEDEDWFNRAREQGLVVRRLDQICLIVRRHETNMTRGKTLIELAGLRIVKKALDRSRATGDAVR